jgi:multiple sugar transport system permease protein
MSLISARLSPHYFNRDRIFTFGVYCLAIIYSLIVIIPVYYVLISSFKSNSEIYAKPLKLPETWTLEKFQVVQERVNMVKAVGVSFMIIIGAEAINLVLAFLAAYAIARIPTRLSRLSEMIFSAGFLIPIFAILVPTYLLAVKAGLLNNPLSLIFFLSSSRLPLTVVTLAARLREIPKEIEESAEIDGASRLQIIFLIVFPIAISGVITVLIINFISFWNEYLFAWILLSGNPAVRTVQMTVPLLRGEKNIDYGLVAAAVTMSLVPIAAVFIFFQERIVSGSTSGAVKG